MTQEKPIWVKYNVEWRFFTSLCGSVPASPDVVRDWLDARKPEVRPPGGKSLDEITEEVFATLAETPLDTEEQIERMLLTFQRVDGALMMRASTIRAHLKDCARVISTQFYPRKEGEAAFSTRVINTVYPDPDGCVRALNDLWVPLLGSNGERVTAATGRRTKFTHPRTGVSAIKIFEFVDEAVMRFRLMVLAREQSPEPAVQTAAINPMKQKKDKPKIVRSALKLSDFETLLTYGGVHGYAGERSDGLGKYTFTIEEVKTNVERIETAA